MSRPALSDRPASRLEEHSPVWTTVERVALILVIGLVVARATLFESIRDVNPVVPGQVAAPDGPGPVTILVFALLAIVPAGLVLLRRAVDPTYRLTGTTPSALLLALALLAGISSMWASDRFAALVSAAQLLSAAAVLWTTAQLVRDWARFRIPIAAAFGVLLVFIAQGIGYRAFDLPQMTHQWTQDIGGIRTNTLRERGWQADDPPARKFEQKVLAGEMIGYTASANTFAAATVLLVMIAVGIALHRLSQRERALAAAPVVAVIAAAWLIYHTSSNAAYVTPLLGGALLAATAAAHGWIARHRRLLFILACCGFALAAAALVGHGLYHGSLPQVSLTFRWRYWVAAADMFADHPLLGVGYANFGNHYLAYRLPAAAEEIRDPHNLLVRFAVELGLIGLLLAGGWLAMLWWRFSRPKLPDALATNPGVPLAVTAALAIAAGFLLNLIASVDFAQDGNFLLLEVFKRLFYLLLLLAGAAAVMLRSMHDRALDVTPAPWIVRSVIIALSLFMLHNMIDFSFFEAGPMHLFALLAGSVIGVRARSSEAPGRGSRGGWLSGVAGVCVLWLAAVVMIVAPVLLAEDHARAGNMLLRAGNARAAADRYAAAFSVVPFNADYAYRTATALAQSNASPERVRAALDQAIVAEPTNVLYRLTRARYVLGQEPGRIDAALDDFADAVALNPHDIDIRWEYAQLLVQAGRPADAAAQAEAALAVNDAYAFDETEKLTEDRVEAMRAFVARHHPAAGIEQ